MARQSRPQLFDILLKHDPELHSARETLPPVIPGIEGSQSTFEFGDFVQEILERSLTGESGGSDGRELEKLMFRRSEGLKAT